MASSATAVLTGEDELYDALYDVRREAEEIGNYIAIDPYAGLNALRAQAPVLKGNVRDLMGLPRYHRQVGALDRGCYSALTFDVCDKAFRDNVNFSSDVFDLDGSGTGGKGARGILEMDNPRHFAYRRAVQSLFIKPKVTKWWREKFIGGLVEELVASLHGKDRAELNLQLCARVPVHTITRAMGLRGEDALTFRNALVGTQGSNKGIDAQMTAHRTVQHMLMEQISQRHRAPGEDILSWLLAAEITPPGETDARHLTDGEVVNMARLIMLAGGGTTWRQMGITIMALLQDRDQLEAVREDRKLLDAATEESLRWNPTNPMFSRQVMHDTELGGVMIPKGAMLDIVLGAANRDPARWDNPDVFDLHRPFQQHLGTGIGPHMCLGRFVAQVEMADTINALLDAFPKMRLDPNAPEPFVTGGLEQRGVSALPVLLT